MNYCGLRGKKGCCRCSIIFTFIHIFPPLNVDSFIITNTWRIHVSGCEAFCPDHDGAAGLCDLSILPTHNTAEPSCSSLSRWFGVLYLGTTLLTSPAINQLDKLAIPRIRPRNSPRVTLFQLQSSTIHAVNLNVVEEQLTRKNLKTSKNLPKNSDSASFS